ncbi:TPA: LPXTG cell wall anchor domain-containing protein, partial [Clostridium perfringens]|nr:LPXTG cell wall anchor domain-containing protein [Clostridium perfringens]
NHKSSNSKVLPKTGEVKEFSSLIGAELLGLAGLLFSMFKRKKEDE